MIARLRHRRTGGTVRALVIAVIRRRRRMVAMHGRAVLVVIVVTVVVVVIGVIGVSRAELLGVVGMRVLAARSHGFDRIAGRLSCRGSARRDAGREIGERDRGDDIACRSVL